MSNFKVGQKVVYIGGADNPAFNEPKLNEIVTIKEMCTHHEDSYVLCEYPFGKNGYIQSCHADHLRPLNDSFAEETEIMVQKYATDIEEYLETIKEKEYEAHKV